MKSGFYYQLIIVFILTVSVSDVYSVDIPEFVHYSAERQLSENNVRCILQDHGGKMWFGTDNGINTFDGYSFRTFNEQMNPECPLKNYRIDKLLEDKQGYIWFCTNDGQVYRFNPRDESYLAVPQCVEKYRNYRGDFTDIEIRSDSLIWLYNKKAGNLFCVENKLNDKISIRDFKECLKSGFQNIKEIFLDNNSYTWIISENKVYGFSKKHIQKAVWLKTSKTVNCVSEIDGKLYFGGDSGYFVEYNRKMNTSKRIELAVNHDIVKILALSNTEIFLLFKNGGFCVFNLRSNFLETYTIDKKVNIFNCKIDKRNNIWIDTDDKGAYLFVLDKRSLLHPTIDKMETYSQIGQSQLDIVENEHGDIWVQTRISGFFKFNYSSLRFEYFYNNPEDHERKFSSLIHNVLCDKQENLWISTYSQGLEKISFHNSVFTFNKPANYPLYSFKIQIKTIYEDQNKWLWICSREGQVYLYDHNRKYLGLLGYDGKINGSQPFNTPVFDIMEDSSGAIWLATKGDGVFRIVRNNRQQFNIEHFKNDASKKYSISSDNVYSLYQDAKNRIWIGTFENGINIIENPQGPIRFKNINNVLRYPTGICKKVRFITGDKHGNVFVGTTSGLLVASAHLETEKIYFKHYDQKKSDSLTLTGNDVYYMLAVRNGDVYFAVSGGGVCILRNGYEKNKNYRFEHLKSQNFKLPGIIYTLREDKAGNIWMSTQTNIIRFNPTRLQFDTYKPEAGFNYFFVESAVFASDCGNLFYGTSGGYIEFDPVKVSKSTYLPPLCFTQLLLYSKPANVNEKNSPLKKHINYTDTLILSHKQNMLAIEYSALEYSHPELIQYAYKLENFDTEWNYVGNQRTASYTNLPKGAYTLIVKSTDTSGRWLNNEKRIVIIRMPSFWESYWGYLFYFFVFVLLLGLGTYILLTIYKLKHKVVVERQLANFKLQFFTDISHELRTPLTLITSPVEYLLKNTKLPDVAVEQLNIVKVNTDRMLRLMTQILDFRKVQSGKMRLTIAQTDVCDELRKILLNIGKTAELNNIKIELINQCTDTQIWLDRDMFEKIMYNLLSNALKYSRSGKTITVRLKDTVNDLKISVIDEGRGVDASRMKTIFDRYESSNDNVDLRLPGTGIGLPLTKELVELHNGTITVESNENRGSCFSVGFKKGINHFSVNENFILSDSNDPIHNNDYQQPVMFNELADQKENKPIILVLEDNNELRHFLRTVLSFDYQLLESADGLDAISIALNTSPDIILSDIMMKGMDGLEFVERIKTDIETSHIPVILLTAKTDIETKLLALSFGIDDYITKPFSSSLLIARIENILNNRKQLREYYRNTLTSGVFQFPESEQISYDETFIKKTMEFISNNYQDSELNIDTMAVHCGLSRSAFFRKLKNTTGLAPVDLIKEFRLQQSIRLLDAGETNISQVAYAVGFDDPNYFSKCFKLKFKCTPRDYRLKD